MSVEGFTQRCLNRIKELEAKIAVLQRQYGYTKVPFRLVSAERGEIAKLKEAIKMANRKGITEIT